MVRQLAQENHCQLIEINFERNPEYQSAFTSNDPSQILATLDVLLGESFQTEGALLFLDEIQASPQALVSLRYFYEERPDIAVIAASSLLEFALADAQFSMPVGRIEYFHMGPMSSMDFLVALSEVPLANYLQQVKITFDRAPAVVGQKFKYVNISRDYRAADVASTLNQLCMARVFFKIIHTSANGVPLGAESNEKHFKVLFMDVGLMCSALKIRVLDLQNEDINLINKGAVSEQFIGQN